LTVEMICNIVVAVVVLIIGIISIANRLYYARENGKLLENELAHINKAISEIKEMLKNNAGI